MDILCWECEVNVAVDEKNNFLWGLCQNCWDRYQDICDHQEKELALLLKNANYGIE